MRDGSWDGPAVLYSICRTEFPSNVNFWVTESLQLMTMFTRTKYKLVQPTEI